MHLSCPFAKYTKLFYASQTQHVQELVELHLVAAVIPFSKNLPPSSPCPAEQAVLQEIKWRHAVRSLMPQ